MVVRGDQQCVVLRAVPFLIEDEPLLEYRGLLLDTARNYYSVPMVCEPKHAFVSNHVPTLCDCFSLQRF